MYTLTNREFDDIHTKFNTEIKSLKQSLKEAKDTIEAKDVEIACYKIHVKNNYRRAKEAREEIDELKIQLDITKNHFDHNETGS